MGHPILFRQFVSPIWQGLELANQTIKGAIVTDTSNALGQPVGFPVPGWTTRPRPSRTPITGRYCRVEMLDPARHAADLFAGNQLDTEGRNWTYLPYGPFAKIEDYRAWLDSIASADDPLFHTIVDLASGKAVASPV